MLNAHLVSPFAMLLNPEHVILAMEHSELLNHLHSHIYHPLDKPMMVKGLAISTEVFDRLIDEAADEVWVEAESPALVS